MVLWRYICTLMLYSINCHMQDWQYKIKFILCLCQQTVPLCSCSLELQHFLFLRCPQQPHPRSSCLLGRSTCMISADPQSRKTTPHITHHTTSHCVLSHPVITLHYTHHITWYTCPNTYHFMPQKHTYRISQTVCNIRQLMQACKHFHSNTLYDNIINSKRDW